MRPSLVRPERIFTIAAGRKLSSKNSSARVHATCTGLPAAFVVEELEQELGKPVFDSVLVTLWKGLQLVGVTDPLPGFGALMRAAEQVAL